MGCLDICVRPLLVIGLSEAVRLLFMSRKERNGLQSFDLLFAGGIRVARRFDSINVTGEITRRGRLFLQRSKVEVGDSRMKKLYGFQVRVALHLPPKGLQGLE